MRHAGLGGFIINGIGNDMREEDLPCGNCDMGIYATECLVEAANFCLGKQTQKEALRSAPRCKTLPKRICMGARDFIVASPFPFTEEKRQEILRQLD